MTVKHLLLSALALCAALWADAQMAEVSAPKALLKGVQSEMYYPQLSQDGTKLMFSAANFTDLRLYDYTDNVTVKLEATPTQAFGARFKANRVSYDRPTAGTRDGKLFVTVGGEERQLDPVPGSNGYCWGSLSPDGKRIVFIAAGRGTYVCDLKGQLVASLPEFASPVWYGDSHLIVANSTDDGHQYHSSQIVLLDLEGNRQDLTKPESMTMNPTAAIAANRVVYCTIDGRLYELTVKLK